MSDNEMRSPDVEKEDSADSCLERAINNLIDENLKLHHFIEESSKFNSRMRSKIIEISAILKSNDKYMQNLEANLKQANKELEEEKKETARLQLATAHLQKQLAAEKDKNSGQ